MIWATVTIPGNASTHYFMDTASLCKNNSVTDDSSLVRHATSGDKLCTVCKSILKSQEIHKLTQRQQRAFNLHQKHSEKFGKSLVDILCTWLDFYSKSKSVTIKEFEEFFTGEYRNVSFGAMLVSLLASKKVTISQGYIIPNFVEVYRVY